MDWTRNYKPARRRIALAAVYALIILLLTACTGLPRLGDTERTSPAPAATPATLPNEQPNARPRDTHAVQVSERRAEPATVRRAPKPVPTDLWERVRDGLVLDPPSGSQVRYYEKWYANRPDYVLNMTARCGRYLFHFVEQVDKRGMPMEVALLPTIESACKPQAYSRARASGLWQFIPSTGRRYGLKQNWWYDGRRNVVDATDAALNYLEFLHDEFDGDWHLALAAYNAGENKIKRTRAYNKRRGRATNYESLRLRRETRHYVPKLMAVANIVKNPAKYGLKLTPVPNRPAFVQVDVGSQIDLGVAAQLSGMKVDELYALNPAFRRWATAPNGPHTLLVPVGKETKLVAGLEKLPPQKRMQWTRYVVKKGDNLGQIGRRYGVSVRSIQSSNRIRGSMIRAGQDLLIPLSTRKYAGLSPQPKAKAPRRATASSNKRVVHRVRKGDTLWAIARKYGVYVHQLSRWNGIHPRGTLRLGQRILVYPR